jgi:hypothetical protein
LSGVWNWGKGGELIPDLAGISWQGRRVYIVFDSDGATNKNVQDAARRLAEALEKLGAIVHILLLPSGPDGAKAGIDDFLCVHTADDLKKLLKEAAESVPAEPAVTWEPPPWPKPPEAEAFHGLAGEIVRTIEPSSEADPVALLVQTLIVFGNVIGRWPHFTVESDRHGGNEFAVLVGRTSKARKGTSYGRIEPLPRGADPEWLDKCVPTGSSSGEGIVWAIRDPITKSVKVKGSKPVRFEEAEVDKGVTDKRLLVYEPEFVNVLKQTEREGNNLSAVIRQAWDGRRLGNLNKNSPAKASNPHVSMIGHITEEELRRYLTATESANGFANRYLWVCAERSKVLPEGGRMDEDRWRYCMDNFKERVAFARMVQQIRRDESGRGVWLTVYETLSEGKPGLAGSMLARGEAHVMRLALLYALLDRSEVISEPHLVAALALWEYCERSVRHIFGDSLGDPVADEILRLLRARKGVGMTRNEIREFFQRNKSSERIGQALGLLLQCKMVRFEKRGTCGRSEERWFAV